MKVAVTYEKETGNVFQHFGKTQYFKIYQIEDGKILSSEVIDNGGNGHHAIPPYLKSLGVEHCCQRLKRNARNHRKRRRSRRAFCKR